MRYSYDAGGNLVEQTAGSGGGLPEILGQPQDHVGPEGKTAFFSVLVADTRGVTFQWQHAGVNILGATGDSLVLPGNEPLAGGPYRVVVTNTAGSATSDTAWFYVDSDGNGLPDAWEVVHFGGTGTQRSAGDPDGDGTSNLQEFLDATDPMDPTSLRPRLVAYGDADGSVDVSPRMRSYGSGLADLVLLTASPTTGARFVGWSGDLTGNTNPATVLMNANKLVRGRFASRVPIPAGLVAWWRGESDGADAIGGHTGTFYVGGSPTLARTTPSGKVGGAFDFDGSVYVQIPAAPDLMPPQFSVEAWVYPTVPSGDYYQTVIEHGSSTSGHAAWSLSLFYGRVHFTLYLGGDLVGPVLPKNVWTHVAATFDGETKRLFLDGSEVGVQGGVAAGIVYDPVPLPLTIGTDLQVSASQERFHGRLDELALYHRALTPDEVRAIYLADLTGKDFERPYLTLASPLPNAAVGVPYTVQLTSVQGGPPIAFSTSSGSLPPGLSLSSSGVVGGTPIAAGSYDVTVVGTDVNGSRGDREYRLRVM